MKKNILLIAAFLLSLSCFAQNVVMHQTVDDTIIPKHGPNLKNFTHYYIGYGFIAGQPEATGSDINYGKSGNFIFGIRYKLKVCKFYAIGYDISFNTYSFNLKQDSSKITPNKIQHDKEVLNISNIGLGLYNRFNYGRRGNQIGKFVDLGAYGDLKIGGTNFTRDKMDNGNIIKTTISKLNYLEPLNYGVFGRIGFNRYVLYGSYRLSDIFESSYIYPELPRLTIGLQIGFHK